MCKVATIQQKIQKAGTNLESRQKYDKNCAWARVFHELWKLKVGNLNADPSYFIYFKNGI